MTIRVLLFASWSEALGSRVVEVDVAPGATAADVLAAVQSRAPGGASLARPAVAVNQRIADPATPVAEDDEVALIPPVAGG